MIKLFWISILFLILLTPFYGDNIFADDEKIESQKLKIIEMHLVPEILNIKQPFEIYFIVQNHHDKTLNLQLTTLPKEGFAETQEKYLIESKNCILQI